MFGYIFTLISSLPLLVFIFSLMSHRHYKVLIRPLSISVFIWLVFFGIAFGMNIDYLRKYQFPILPNHTEIFIMGGVIFSLAFIIFLVSVITSIVQRTPFRKMLHLLFNLFGVFGFIFLHLMLVFLFILPAGEKADYIEILKRAHKAFEKMSTIEEQPIAAAIVESQQHCYSSKSSSCRDSNYENLVVVKNFSKQNLNVNIEVQFYDRNDQLMQTTSVDHMSLQAGAEAPLLTKETKKNNSMWKSWSSSTDHRVAYIKYHYQYSKQ
ncbi:hypothetical protein [Heyndrickxia oleronia]|uniref:hypothetical protein n=1 Tax=Heyndrickxia oleronia TaxID=38875 RepID=UPI003F8451D1